MPAGPVAEYNGLQDLLKLAPGFWMSEASYTISSFGLRTGSNAFTNYVAWILDGVLDRLRLRAAYKPSENMTWWAAAPQFQFDFTLQKRFLREGLTLSLWGRNIFPIRMSKTSTNTVGPAFPIRSTGLSGPAWFTSISPSKGRPDIQDPLASGIGLRLEWRCHDRSRPPEPPLIHADTLAGSLAGLAHVFESRGVWAVRAILAAETRSKGPFEIVTAVPEGSSLYCILPSGSFRYHSQLVIGIDENGIGELFPDEPDPKMRKDAIGEMANVTSGLFIAEDDFVEKFGRLKPSAPFFSEGAFTDRQDWSLKGTVEANGQNITLYFSIRELT